MQEILHGHPCNSQTNRSVKMCLKRASFFLACGSHHIAQLESMIEFRQFRGTLDHSLTLLFRDKTRQTGVSSGFLGGARTEQTEHLYCIHIYGSKFVCLASYHLLRPSFTASPGQAPPWACVFSSIRSRVEEFLRTTLVNICHRAYTWFAYFGQEAATFPASQNMLGIRQANSAGKFLRRCEPRAALDIYFE
jgi:hypothetical protein